ncbi:MAG: ATP-binding protein [Acidobacteriota bacterium]
MINYNREIIYIKRNLEEKIKKYLETREIIAIVGPRQSGKTTLMKQIFLTLPSPSVFLDFEDRETLSLFQQDIKTFAKMYVGGKKFIFIDEFQYAENGGKLLKYLYDHSPAKFLISGSSSIDITVKTVKYLTGRIFVFELLPLNFDEFLHYKNDEIYRNFYLPLKENVRVGKLEREKLPDEIHKKIMEFYEEFVLWGGYPRVHISEDSEEREMVLQNIINTYLLRDIRGLLQLSTEYNLQRLIKSLAFQISNLIQYNELSQTSDLPHISLKKHLKILEQTYITIFSYPFYTNKRLELVKNPKIYFLDTGLRNSLIKDFKPLSSRTDKGFLVENVIATEIYKNGSPLHFWRTKSKAEVDFIIEKGKERISIEVKSSIKTKAGKSLISFIDKYSPERIFVLYPGNVNKIIYNKKEIYFLPYYFL